MASLILGGREFQILLYCEIEIEKKKKSSFSERTVACGKRKVKRKIRSYESRSPSAPNG